MENTIKLLAEIATELDNKNYPLLADKVDSIAKAALSVKTAQYTGSQGYAIRNSRCFGNCYRNKRMQFPKMSAQEVWFDCHREYIESINDDNAEWNKYADSSSEIIKTSSVNKNNDKEFISLVEQKIKTGIDHGSAIFASLDEISDKDFSEILTKSNDLLDIASNLVSHPDLAIKIAESAEMLVKEAGPFDFFRGLGQGVKNWSANTQFVGSMKGFVNNLQTATLEFDKNYNQTQGSFNKINGIINSFRQNLDSISSNPQSTPKQKQYAQSALQSMSSLPQSVRMAGKGMTDYRSGIDSLMKSISGILAGNINAAQNQAPQAPQAPQAQNVSTPTQQAQQAQPFNRQQNAGLGNTSYAKASPQVTNYLSSMDPAKLRSLINDIKTNRSFGSANDFLTKESQVVTDSGKPYSVITHPKKPKPYNVNKKPLDLNKHTKSVPPEVLSYLEGLSSSQLDMLLSDIEMDKKGY